jgi:tetratricopeptide (TPR) repeat protein
MTHRTIRLPLALFAAAAVGLVALAAAPAPTPAAPPSEKPGTPAPGGKAADLFKQGKELADAKKFTEALMVFEKAKSTQKDDPDVLNMLAFCLRKTGKLQEARETYHAALKLRPRFPEAREYLGENYLQLAMEQLTILRSYGQEGEAEAKELAEAIAQLAKDAGVKNTEGKDAGGN